MTDARILHARSGAVLQADASEDPVVYEVTSLRMAETRSFAHLDEAERAYEAEVEASERDPEIVARIGGY
jgi:hypothetical protein